MLSILSSDTLLLLLLYGIYFDFNIVHCSFLFIPHYIHTQKKEITRKKKKDKVKKEKGPVHCK